MQEVFYFTPVSLLLFLPIDYYLDRYPANICPTLKTNIPAPIAGSIPVIIIARNVGRKPTCIKKLSGEWWFTSLAIIFTMIQNFCRH